MSYLSDLQDRATQYSDHYGLTGPVDGDADAFRHAYSSAEMTRDVGPESANHAGTWWEILGLTQGQSEAAARMDNWNNYIGREIAQRLGPNATNDQLAEEVHRALNDGRLVRKPEPGQDPFKPFKDWWDRAKKWIWPRDPIILDLDGDGLETVGLTSNIYFDHDGDGVLTKTGWAGKDDALLVWDRNANGTIDTGAELFGDFTVLPNGTLAPNGFAALAALDSNGDGILDASDPAFAELKLWRDVSQDGVSQAGELITLAEAGIVSLNLANTLKNQGLSNGNILAREGSFTRDDGTTSAMGEFKLATDTSSTQFAEQIEVPEKFKTLPNVGGAGNVRELQQAATLSGSVAQLLEQFQAATTRTEQKALLDKLMTAWADTSGMAKSLEERADGKYRIQYEAFGNERRSSNLDAMFVTAGSGSVNGGSALMTDFGGMYLSEHYRNLIADWSRKLHVLEAFNGQYFFNLPDKKSQTDGANWGLAFSASSGGSGSGALLLGVAGTLTVNFSQTQLDFLQQAYDNLTEGIYASLVMQTRLKPYLDQVELIINDSGLRFDTTQLNQMLEAKKAVDPENYLADLLELNHYAGGVLSGTNWSGLADLDSLIETLPQTAAITALLDEFKVSRLTSGDDTIYLTSKADIVLGGDGKDTLHGYSGNDQLFGQGGDDHIYADSGDDLLSGGAGNDILYGGAGSDTYVFDRGYGHDVVIEGSWSQDTDRILFKAGVAPSDVRLERVRTVNGWQVTDDLRITIRDTGETLTVKDHFREGGYYAIEQIVFAGDSTMWDMEMIKSLSLLGEAGNDELRGFDGRDDVLVGGAGDDVLTGGSGSDVYRFGLGDGQDVIHEGFTAGEDAVELTPGITPADVSVRWTLQGDMTITLPDGSRMTVRNQANTWSKGLGIEQLRFADGTVWDRTELASRALAASAGDDVIVGSYQDDTLDGGAGNDHFQNLGGYDTYVFGSGDGHDVIEVTTGRLLFKPGIDQNDVSFSRDGSDLIATISASGDTVRLKGWLGGWSWQRIDRFDFDNGASLGISEILDKLNVHEGAEILYGSPGDDVLNGTEKDSTLYGREGNDVLTGGAGSDKLYGEAGDDTLDGGADRDWLYGGQGNNSYIVSKGMGLDNAVGASLAIANDTVIFAAGIRPEDVSVQLGDTSWGVIQAGDVGYENLVIGIGGNDALVVSTLNWDDLGRGAIQHFRFADGTEWTLAELMARADGGKYGWQERYRGDATTIVGSQGDDNINDYTGESVTVLVRGNDDNIHLAGGNNRVSAGSGHDNVYLGFGDDLVAGEAGDDNLNTGEGNDVIVFNYGDGHDMLSAGGGRDTLSFGADVTPALISAAVGFDGYVVLLVDGGAGGSITLGNTRINDLPGDLEHIQFIDAEGHTRIFDLTGWLQANVGVLQSATTAKPLAFDGTNFELTGKVAPAGGLEAVAYAQSGDLFGTANLANNTPTSGDDVLYGTPNGDTLDAGAGNDIVLGLAGNDKILGGDGNDLIHGGEGDDLLDGGAGNDVIYGGWGADQLTGGGGSDELYGEWGGDTYVYQPGHGEVIIDDDHRAFDLGGEVPVRLALSQGSATNYGYGGGYGGSFVDDAPNILSFGPGIRPEDLRYSEQNGDLVIEFANQPGDRVILRGYESGRATKTRSVDIIRFTDGTEIVAGSIEIIGRTEIGGDEGGWLTGTPFADILIGGNGDDQINGQGGADKMVGGVGSDTYAIYKEPGSGPVETVIAETWRAQDINRIEVSGQFNPDDLRLEFDGSDLMLRLSKEGDVIRFAGFDPRDSSMPAPVTEISLYWQGVTLSFDDLLARGVWYGNQTNDVYRINLGDGLVTIVDSATADAGNTIQFGPGIDTSVMRNNLRFEEDGNGGHVLLVPYGEAGDVVRLTGFDPQDVLGNHAVQNFEFSDGTVVDYATLVSWTFVVEGDSSGNALVGTNVNDRLYGYDGDDVMDSGDGKDVLTGGLGNDVLRGGAQRDAYVVNLGDGEDVIEDGLDAGVGNVLTFGTGITREGVLVEVDGDDLLIRYGTNGDMVRVSKYAPNGKDGGTVIDTFEFADGTTVTLREFMNSAPEVANSIDDQVVQEGATFRLKLPDDLFIDADGDSILTRVMASGYTMLPDWLQYDAATRTLFGTPSKGDVGEFDIIVQGMDTLGASSLYSFHVTVNNANYNHAPEVGAPLSDMQVLEDSHFSFTLPVDSFRDVDVGDVLTYQATLENGRPLPSWLHFDAQTGTFSGTPDNSDVGELRLSVAAIDQAGAWVSQVFTLEVVNTNDAPVTGYVLTTQTATKGTAFNYAIPPDSFVDLDPGDRLSYSVTLADGSALPSWLKFDPQTNTLSGIPNASGNYALKVTATDLAGAQVSQTFTLEVKPDGSNEPPITAPDGACVIEDRKLLACGNVLSNDRDPEGKRLKVANPGILRGEYGVLTLLSNGSYIYALNNCSSKVQGLGAGETVADTFNYLASDGSERSTGALTVTVQGTNDRPDLVRCLSNVQLTKGKAFSWQMPAGTFRDVDRNDKLSYTATLSNGKALPSWLKFNAATQTFSGTAPSSTKGCVDVRITASDGKGAYSTASDVFRITIGNKTVVPTPIKGKAFVGDDADALLSWNGTASNTGGPSQEQYDSKQIAKRNDDSLSRFLDSFKGKDSSRDSALPALDRQWFEASDEQQQLSGQASAQTSQDVERHWAEMNYALDQLDAERQSAPAWTNANQGSDLAGLAGLMQGGGSGARGGVDAVSLSAGSGTLLKAFSGIKEGVGRLSW